MNLLTSDGNWDISKIINQPAARMIYHNVGIFGVDMIRVCKYSVWVGMTKQKQMASIAAMLKSITRTSQLVIKCQILHCGAPSEYIVDHEAYTYVCAECMQTIQSIPIYKFEFIRAAVYDDVVHIVGSQLPRLEKAIIRPIIYWWPNMVIRAQTECSICYGGKYRSTCERCYELSKEIYMRVGTRTCLQLYAILPCEIWDLIPAIVSLYQRVYVRT